MSHLGRALVVVGALVAGVLGALTGTPAWLANLYPHKPAVSVGPLQRTINARFEFPRRSEPLTDLELLIESRLKEARSDDPAHDFVRRSAVRAAVSYVYAPCDEYSKRVLVEAVADYVRAYQELRGCSYFCSAFKVDSARRAFTTSSLDRLVTDSVRRAYERGGFSAADFPSSMAADLTDVVGLGEREQRICTPPLPLPYVPRAR